LKASCALTLARKYKLETLSKVFQKFGKNLKCPETDKEIYQPKNLKVSVNTNTQKATANRTRSSQEIEQVH
jgi:hypothetical protein